VTCTCPKAVQERSTAFWKRQDELALKGRCPIHMDEVASECRRCQRER
jgi:hypothetical protein